MYLRRKASSTVQVHKVITDQELNDSNEIPVLRVEDIQVKQGKNAPKGGQRTRPVTTTSTGNNLNDLRNFIHAQQQSAMKLAGPAKNEKSRLLDGIAPPDLKVILAAGKHRQFVSNSVVVNQGNPANQLFLLTKGRARFFFDTPDGKKVNLLWLTPGEIFGESALLSNSSSYLVSAETLKDSSMLVWDRETLRNLVGCYPRLLENALLISYDYLAWYIADHVALISHTARQRLASVLVCLAQTIGKRVADGFEFDAKNEELASAANVTAFTTSRLLSEWRSKGAVLKRRGKVVLRSQDGLFLNTI